MLNRRPRAATYVDGHHGPLYVDDPALRVSNAKTLICEEQHHD